MASLAQLIEQVETAKSNYFGKLAEKYAAIGSEPTSQLDDEIQELKTQLDASKAALSDYMSNNTFLSAIALLNSVGYFKT